MFTGSAINVRNWPDVFDSQYAADAAENNSPNVTQTSE